jgi:uncharacterized membrane protein
MPSLAGGLRTREEAMSVKFETLRAPWPLTLPAQPVIDTAANARPRLDSIDLLRGLVMVLMALDHTRDFFGASGMNPRDVADPALFLTRWITHYCAPIFILLAGTSAYLYGARGRSTAEISRFLITRGFWLMLLEFTIVRLGWTFDMGLDHFVTQVIWAIGASMVVLAGLVWLPRAAISAIGLAVIVGHNAFDGVTASDFGAYGWIWNFLHEPKLLTLAPGSQLYALYPLIPWAGVMAAGYALGPVFLLDAKVRRRLLLDLGAAITVAFVVLRLSNVYGDPAPWAVQETGLSTVLSVLNVEKYPPSLLYLMMTLGPALMLLALFERVRGDLAQWITTFGRVPLLYYVAHIFLIHALAVVLALVAIGDATWLIGGLPSAKPADYGLPLPGVYAVWLMVVVALYPLCAWFAQLKRRRSEWWWSYL